MKRYTARLVFDESYSTVMARVESRTGSIVFGTSPRPLRDPVEKLVDNLMGEVEQWRKGRKVGVKYL